MVQALVDAKADGNFQRTGMTMTQEAGACPAAAILKKAGAKWARDFSEVKEPADLHRERPVPQEQRTRGGGAVLVGVDDEELAAWDVFPSKPEIAAECVIGGRELHVRTREHSRREPIIASDAHQARREIARRQIDAANRDAWLNRESG